MKRWLFGIGIVLATLAMAVFVVVVAAWVDSGRAMRARPVVADPPLPPIGDGALAHGEHLFRSRGCSDCHGARGEGRVVADVAPMRMVASNLTPAGQGRHYDADAFGRAIRHGVGHDGRALLLMPIQDYAELSDADTAALAHFLTTLPPVDHDPGTTQVRPLGRLLHLFGQLDLAPGVSIDHAPRARAAPAAAASVDYGGYVARTCSGCHRADYRGGPVHGMPPDLPPASDLTALEGWQAADFLRLMREGKRPDGSDVHPLMPWGAFKTMTDDELTALWLYFDSLPAAPVPG